MRRFSTAIPPACVHMPTHRRIAALVIFNSWLRRIFATINVLEVHKKLSITAAKVGGITIASDSANKLLQRATLRMFFRFRLSGAGEVALPSRGSANINHTLPACLFVTTHSAPSPLSPATRVRKNVQAVAFNHTGRRRFRSSIAHRVSGCGPKSWSALHF